MQKYIPPYEHYTANITDYEIETNNKETYTVREQLLNLTELRVVMQEKNDIRL